MEILTEFTIPGPPVGKKRAGQGTKRYTPGTTREFERIVGFHAKRGRMTRTITPQPVGLILNIYYEPPKSWKADERKRALDGEIIPALTPDCSNVLKSVEDGMNKIIYEDDRQISDIRIRRRYAQATRINVTVYKLT